MGTKDLKKFIEENEVEYRYQYNEETHKEDVLIFPYVCNIEEFTELIKDGSFHGEECIKMELHEYYFAIWMSDICGTFGIKLSNVFDKE